MSVKACAELVQRGDPDRFLAAMAAPVGARRVLFPLYAFNLEVARAPWASAEPLIVEMRLQWWRDALDEIAEGRPVRRHEVSLPLAEVLDAEGARLLDRLVAARRMDVEVQPFAEMAAFDRYLDETGGTLAWVAARALGASGERAVRDVAWAGALANYLLGVPQLALHGRVPLPPGADLTSMAEKGLERLQRGRRDQEATARPALLAAWQAEGVLRKAWKDPEAVERGALKASEFRRRLRLMWAAATGRV
ncbi:squalene/phytoene synthase family protein [Roseitranquillus sediminis]|uniref:squalene/phytoene synthase family protein n=1 Tax=Roseitranquillus sediminis TaxID=2809051 RepID=UPI001D0CBAC0|nr:squalene/phytoene synthase family protein [Roseitranquillus sediminis]MBM9593062.1 squalene/phytoene synthase family protein [Roseitranquillus sediminis]